MAVLPIALVYFYIASHLIFYSFYSEAWNNIPEDVAIDEQNSNDDD